MNEREELERLRRQKRLIELESREKATAPTQTMAQQEASVLGMEPVGTYKDGTIYKAPDGSMQFVSPGYSTGDPQAIKNMMEERRPYRDAIGMTEGALRAGYQGQSFNFGDEATARVAATLDKALGRTPGTWDELYSAYLARERDNIEQFQEEQPEAALGAEVVGALTTVGGMVGSGKTAVKAGQTARQRALAAGGEGTAYGTLAGVGNSEGGAENRAIDGAFGGVLGGTTGMAGSALVTAVGRGWDVLRRKLAPKFGTPEGRAKAQLAAAMADSGMTPEQITAKLDSLGGEGMVMDAMGEPGRALARTSANNSPAAREMLETASVTRMAGQPDRLTDKLLEAGGLDEPRTVRELQDAARAEARPGIKAAYEEARSLGNDIDLEAFADIRGTRIGKEAFEEGMAAARDRMRGKGEPSALDVLDEAKKYLDGIAQPDAGKRPTPRQAFAGELAKDIRDRTDEWLDEYANARGKARDLFKREEAYELGAEGAKPRVAADFGRRVAANSNDDAVRAGYAAAKVDQVQNRRATPGAVDALFGPRRQQEALDTALGPNAGPVRRQIDAEREFGLTDRALRGNSTTARQLVEAGIIGGGGAGAGLYLGGDAESAGLGLLASILLRRGGGAAANALWNKSNKATANIVAEILASPAMSDPMARRELAEALVKSTASRGPLPNVLPRAAAAQAGGQAQNARSRSERVIGR